jgi:hypothetical protein
MQRSAKITSGFASGWFEVGLGRDSIGDPADGTAERACYLKTQTPRAGVRAAFEVEKTRVGAR